MCLIGIAWKAHPAFPLVIAANRDEFHQRPARGATWWAAKPGIFAGRDLLGGGTWMGATRSGRFAALTNYRDPARNHPDAPSRGVLVSGFLQNDEPPFEYLERVRTACDRYNGFNLVCGDAESVWVFSNITGEPVALEPGVHGLSNHLLDSPWPKVVAIRHDLETCLAGLPCAEPVFSALAARRQACDEALPNTGIGIEWERRLSPAFIVTPKYGTRSSTVLLRSADGRMDFEERSFDPEGRPLATVREDWVLRAP